MKSIISNDIRANVEADTHKDKEYYCPWDVAEYLWPHIKQFSNFPDSSEEFKSELVQCLFGHIMQDTKDYMLDWCAKARKFMSGKKPKDGEWVGDMDTWLYVIMDSESKTVFRLYDSPTCADINNWIIVYDHCETEESVYIAQIWMDSVGRFKSDYPKTQYTTRPNLKFWKDREYNTDFEDKYHFTKLGGIYGDSRDPGYLISFSRYIGCLEALNDIKPSRIYDMWPQYNKWQHMMSNVKYMSRAFPSK